MTRTRTLAPPSLMRTTSLPPCSSNSCASQPSRNASLLLTLRSLQTAPTSCKHSIPENGVQFPIARCMRDMCRHQESHGCCTSSCLKRHADVLEYALLKQEVIRGDMEPNFERGTALAPALHGIRSINL